MSLKTYEEAFNDVMEEILDIVKIQPSEYTISFEQSGINLLNILNWKDFLNVVKLPNAYWKING